MAIATIEIDPDMPKPPMTLSEAIAREEGYYVFGTRARRNNNPGNLEYGAFTRAYGATHGDPRFAIFPTPEIGFTALINLLTKHYGGKTVADAIRSYAPSTENDTESYIRNICAWCEVPPTAIISEISDGNNNSTYTPSGPTLSHSG
jgi:hypothetical protein